MQHVKLLFFAVYLALIIFGAVTFIRDGHPFQAAFLCLPGLMIVLAILTPGRGPGHFAMFHDFGPVKPEKQESESESQFHLKIAKWWLFCFLICLFPTLIGILNARANFISSKEDNEMALVVTLFISFLLGIPCLIKFIESLIKALWYFRK